MQLKSANECTDKLGYISRITEDKTSEKSLMFGCCCLFVCLCVLLLLLLLLLLLFYFIL